MIRDEFQNISTQTMRLSEWVSTFNYYNTTDTTKSPMEVDALVIILQIDYQSTPSKQHQMDTETHPYQEEDNYKASRDLILIWLSHYIFWITQIYEELGYINATVLNMSLRTAKTS